MTTYYIAVNAESFTVFLDEETCKAYIEEIEDVNPDIYMQSGDDMKVLLADCYGEELKDCYGDDIDVEEFLKYISENGTCLVTNSRGEFFTEYMMK